MVRLAQRHQIRGSVRASKRKRMQVVDLKAHDLRAAAVVLDSGAPSRPRTAAPTPVLDAYLTRADTAARLAQVEGLTVPPTVPQTTD